MSKICLPSCLPACPALPCLPACPALPCPSLPFPSPSNIETFEAEYYSSKMAIFAKILVNPYRIRTYKNGFGVFR
jgi:hypothetical protein